MEQPGRKEHSQPISLRFSFFFFFLFTLSLPLSSDRELESSPHTYIPYRIAT